MDRRDFLSAAAGSLATSATSFFSGVAFAGTEAGAVQSDLLITDAKALKQLQALAKAASDCAAAGEACAQHCQEELIKGNAKDFTECSITVQQMIPICENVGKLAAFKAKIIADFLDGCIKACDTCEKACKKHEAHFAHGMHMPCKHCLEACAACRDACQKMKTLI